MRVVASSLHVLHDPRQEILFGAPQPYPEKPARAEIIRSALEQDGRFDVCEPSEHGRAPVEAVHDSALVQFLETAWQERQAVAPAQELIPDTLLHPAVREGMHPLPEPLGAEARLGYWTYETCTPIVEGTYVAARASVDVALTAADLLLAGERAVYGLCRPPGHHAPRRAFGGYCYFNNAAIAANYLVAASGAPVAILDIDYHHGNGTQQIFYDRSDVLFVSVHADPRRAYPYFCGFADETGSGAGSGATLNLPLPARVTDDQYLEALEPALARVHDFDSSIVIVSLGFDTHGQDPLGDFALTDGVYPAIARRIASLGRPLLVLQEGGYHLSTLGLNAREFLSLLE